MNSPLAGKTIAVVGAGPAGATAAFLLARSRYARVLLFEQRPLLDTPVAGDKIRQCGGCGGLVQAGVQARLKSLGLALSPQIVQDNLAGFTVHYPKRKTALEIPASGMVTVHRGWGPIRGKTPSQSFDSFLARQASAAGAEFHEEQVTRIQLGDGESTPAVVVTNKQDYPVDFVIGAFGHNHTLSHNIVDSLSQPPPLDTSRVSRGAVREYEFGPAFVEQRYERRVHVVANPTANIRFAAMVPKRGVVSVVLMGHSDTNPSDFDELFAVSSLQHLLPSSRVGHYMKCACMRSSLTTSSPRRFLISGVGGIALIGDAGPTRPRKNGLFAAIDLAQKLVWCIERGGLSQRALLRFQSYALIHYVVDDLWADAMLAPIGDALGIPILGSLAMHALARDKRIPIVTTVMREYARLMLTGEGPYWQIPFGVLGKLLGR